MLQDVRSAAEDYKLSTSRTLMWLTERLAPDFKTIADFRRDNGQGIRNVCRRFVELNRPGFRGGPLV